MEGGEPQRTWTFRIGEALPADDPLARFLVVVSVGLNDNILSNSRFVDANEPYETTYFFHLASGHLFGLAEELRRAHEEWPEVAEFVASLDQQYREDFAAIIALADPDDPTGTKLRHLRNSFFHYPSLRRSTVERGRLPLQRLLRDASDTEGTLRIGGGGLAGGIRALFADELLIQLMTREMSEAELPELLGQLGNLQAAYNRFAQAALGRYLSLLPPGRVTES